MTARRARAADVASRAGVSVTAVSFVFSGKAKGNIAPETRSRILAAAAELGYQPDKLARSLRQRRTHAIGLVTDGIASSPFAGRLVAAAAQRAADGGYAVVMYDTHFHTEREQAAFDELAARRVDALVYATMGLRKLDQLATTALPLVLANCFIEPSTLPSVIPDEVRVGRAAAELLVGHGHRRVAMLAGPGVRRGSSMFTGNVAGPLRTKGFRGGLRAAGVARTEAEVVLAGWDIADGHRAAMTALTGTSGRLLTAARRPTALFAVNDRVAAGAMLAAARLGLDVPRDVSVLGIDDQESLADSLVPGLTTFRLPHAAMGEWAIDAAIALVEGHAGQGHVGQSSLGQSNLGQAPTPEPVRVPFELVERGTLAPPR